MSEASNSQSFMFRDNHLAYQTFGSGPMVLLAFHGFGQNSQVFTPLADTAGRQFTIFAIDLFFHGNSRYAANELLTPTGWCQLIEGFLQVHDIERFSLVGFSLGGRFALATAECFIHRLDQLILIAPDGITRNGWYQLATGSEMGRTLFRYVLRHLSLLTTVGHFLTRFGLLNKTILRFAEISLATPEQRALVYQSWTQFRLIEANLNVLASALNEQGVCVRFFMGVFDRIIPGTYILPLTRRLRHYEITTLKTGHNRLIELAGEKLGLMPTLRTSE